MRNFAYAEIAGSRRFAWKIITPNIGEIPETV